MDTLNKHRGKGQQKITVKHVNVAAGGQAIVGNIEAGKPASNTLEATAAIDLRTLLALTALNARVTCEIFFTLAMRSRISLPEAIFAPFYCQVVLKVSSALHNRCHPALVCAARPDHPDSIAHVYHNGYVIIADDFTDWHPPMLVPKLAHLYE